MRIRVCVCVGGGGVDWCNTDLYGFFPVWLPCILDEEESPLGRELGGIGHLHVTDVVHAVHLIRVHFRGFRTPHGRHTHSRSPHSGAHRHQFHLSKLLLHIQSRVDSSELDFPKKRAYRLLRL